MSKGRAVRVPDGVGDFRGTTTPEAHGTAGDATRRTCGRRSCGGRRRPRRALRSHHRDASRLRTTAPTAAPGIPARVWHDSHIRGVAARHKGVFAALTGADATLRRLLWSAPRLSTTGTATYATHAQTHRVGSCDAKALDVSLIHPRDLARTERTLCTCCVSPCPLRDWPPSRTPRAQAQGLDTLSAAQQAARP
jgi:hypothetical protein